MPKAERIDDPMLFDFEALWGSDHVKLMDDREVAVYMRLLSCQWRESDLPADPKLIALRASHGTRIVSPTEIVGLDGSFAEPGEGSIWEALAPCFVFERDPDVCWSDEKGHGSLWNPRVKEDREAWLEKKKKWSKKSSDAGKASAAARRVRKGSTSGQPLVEPVVEPQVNSLSPSLLPPEEQEGDPQTDLPCSSGHERVRPPTKSEHDFESWWPLMPPKAKTGKAKALKVWCKLPADQRVADPVVLFLDFLRESEAEVYVKEGGQYLPHGAAFVSARPWEDDRASYPPESPNGREGRRERDLGRLPASPIKEGEPGFYQDQLRRRG